MKKHWRCFVCNDIHLGINPPEVCPTCGIKNAYVEISSEEAVQAQSPCSQSMDRGAFLQAITRFAEKNDFQVNPDTDRVNTLLDGLLTNEKNHGLKYCPCRMITKDFEEDLKLVCPCNFTIHETFKDKADGECWCGLFIRRKS